MSEPSHTRELRPGLVAMEDAMLAALLADTELTALTRRIAPFAGEWVDAISEGAWDDPCVLVIAMGGDFSARGPEEYNVEVEWVVVCRARNLRSRAAAQAGRADGEVGAYDLVQHVLRILAHRHFDLDGMRELLPQTFEMERAGKKKGGGLYVYSVKFTCEQELRVVTPDTDLEELRVTTEAQDSDGNWSDVTADVNTPEST